MHRWIILYRERGAIRAIRDDVDSSALREWLDVDEARSYVEHNKQAHAADTRWHIALVSI